MVACTSQIFESGVPMNKRRVVVTGMGMVSPVGNDVATAWQNVVAGNSGIGPITHFDANAFPTRIAGEVKGFDPAQFIAPKDVKKMDTFIQDRKSTRLNSSHPSISYAVF